MTQSLPFRHRPISSRAFAIAAATVSILLRPAVAQPSPAAARPSAWSRVDEAAESPKFDRVPGAHRGDQPGSMSLPRVHCVPGEAAVSAKVRRSRPDDPLYRLERGPFEADPEGQEKRRWRSSKRTLANARNHEPTGQRTLLAGPGRFCSRATISADREPEEPGSPAAGGGRPR